jgi:hypothetical protein
MLKTTFGTSSMINKSICNNSEQFIRKEGRGGVDLKDFSKASIGHKIQHNGHNAWWMNLILLCGSDLSPSQIILFSPQFKVYIQEQNWLRGISIKTQITGNYYAHFSGHSIDTGYRVARGHISPISLDYYPTCWSTMGTQPAPSYIL